MRTVKYEDDDKGNTETLIAVDETMEHKFGNLQRAYNEGFAASDGVRAATAESSGRITNPERSAASRPAVVTNSIDSENPGLADN